MTVSKKELEKILNDLTSIKAKQKFFEIAIANERIEYQQVPRLYIQMVLELEDKDSQVSVNEGSFKKDPQKRVQLEFQAKLAEHVERYDTVARCYKKLGHIKLAIKYAKKAGLDDVAEEWAEEYIQAAYKEDPSPHIYCPNLNPRVQTAAMRAKILGMDERAQEIILEFLSRFNEEDIGKDDRSDLCENLASLAARFDLPEQRERFYRIGMIRLEEEGKYFRALSIAEYKLKDYDKCRLYEDLIEASGNDEQRAHLSEHMEGREFIPGER